MGVAVGGILLGWFALANFGKVRIDFWVFHRQAPLILVIVISGLLGALITALIMRRKPKVGGVRPGPRIRPGGSAGWSGHPGPDLWRDMTSW